MYSGVIDPLMWPPLEPPEEVYGRANPFERRSTPALREPGPSTLPRLGIEHPFVDGKGETLYCRTFLNEDTDLPNIKRLCEEELSEPYNVYTFRYFLQDWPHFTFFIFPSKESTEPIATCICKLDRHRDKWMRGYIGMLSVDKRWRRRGIARKLAQLAIQQLEAKGAEEIAMETEYDNQPSLALYEALGFVREKRLHRFYSNGKDAFRLILALETNPVVRRTRTMNPHRRNDSEAKRLKDAVHEMEHIRQRLPMPPYKRDMSSDIEDRGAPIPPPEGTAAVACNRDPTSKEVEKGLSRDERTARPLESDAADAGVVDKGVDDTSARAPVTDVADAKSPCDIKDVHVSDPADPVQPLHAFSERIPEDVPPEIAFILGGPMDTTRLAALTQARRQEMEHSRW